MMRHVNHWQREQELCDETPEEALVHQRLEQAGAAWRARVPVNDRLNAWVRALPDEMPRDMPHATGLGLKGLPDRIGRWAEAMWAAPGSNQGQPRPRQPRLGGAWAASVAGVVVVGLIGLLLLGSRAFGRSGVAGIGTPLPTPSSTPSPTPLPAAASYVVSLVTAMGADNLYRPIDPTDHFRTNQRVYVVGQVRNAPPGRHRLTIRWYLNGTVIELPSTTQTSVEIPKPDVNFYCTLTYPTPGEGTAKVYWDLPPNTPDGQADRWLVETLSFSVSVG